MDFSAEKTGNIGEKIAAEFLIGKGFTIQEQNYSRKWGELDIVAEQNGVTHFVEVKSVSAASHQQEQPEERVTREKIARLRRAVQTYMIERGMQENAPFQFDVLVVYVNQEKKEAHIKRIPNIQI